MAKQTRRRNVDDVLGPEPASLGKNFKPTTTNMARAYNWYSYFHEVKDARKWLNEFVKNQPKTFKKEEVKLFSQVENRDIPLWLCVNSRLISSGCAVPDGTLDKTVTRVRELISRLKPKVEKKVVQIPVSKEQPVLEKIDVVLDEFYRCDYKATDPKVYDLLTNGKFKPSDANAAYNYYKPLYDEIKSGEGYERLSKRQVKSYQTFVEKILEECKLYSANLRRSTKVRAPRKKKLKTAEQLTSQVKFLAEEKKLKLVSVSPAQIVGAQSVWLFNVKYRKMIYLVAEANSQLTVKGTTIIGYDVKKSTGRTIRKPEIIPQLLNASKASMHKEFMKLKVKDQPITGRINADTMILRVFK